MGFNKRQRFLASLIISAGLFSQGCAIIISKPWQQVPVTSQPQRALIIVDGKEMGYTPLNLRLKKKGAHLIRIQAEGYNPVEIKIERKKSTNRAMTIAGNLLLGIASGLAVHYVVWQASGRPDEEMVLPADFWVGCISGWILFPILDSSSGANHRLSPKELDVALTKTGRNAHAEIVLLNSGQLENIKVIRVRGK